METEIRWHITSIYNYDVQHELNEALTAAVTAQTDLLNQRSASFANYLEDVSDAWNQTVSTEEQSLNANTSAATTMFDNAKAANTTTLNAWKGEQQSRFQAWAADERAAVAHWAADCEEAWEWILMSYCISKDPHNHVSHTG